MNKRKYVLLISVSIIVIFISLSNILFNIINSNKQLNTQVKNMQDIASNNNLPHSAADPSFSRYIKVIRWEEYAGPDDMWVELRMHCTLLHDYANTSFIRHYKVSFQDMYVDRLYTIDGSYADINANISGMDGIIAHSANGEFEANVVTANEFEYHISIAGGALNLVEAARNLSIWWNVYDADRDVAWTNVESILPTGWGETLYQLGFQMSSSMTQLESPFLFLRMVAAGVDFPVGRGFPTEITCLGGSSEFCPNAVSQAVIRFQMDGSHGEFFFLDHDDNSTIYIPNANYFYLNNPTPNYINPYTPWMDTYIIEREVGFNIHAGYKTYTTNQFRINITYFEYLDPLQDNKTGWGNLTYTMRGDTFYSYETEVGNNFTISVIDSSGIVYRQNYLCNTSGPVLDIDLGLNYSYPDFPKPTYVSLYAPDGLGIENEYVKVYANGSRSELPWVTYYAPYLNLYVLDFFNQTLYNTTHSYSSEISIYVPLYTLFIANNFSDPVQIEITRSGTNIKFIQQIGAVSAISYRFLANITYTIKVYFLNGTLAYERTFTLNENNYLVNFGYRLIAISETQLATVKFINVVVIVLAAVVGTSVVWFMTTLGKKLVRRIEQATERTSKLMEIPVSRGNNILNMRLGGR